MVSIMKNEIVKINGNQKDDYQRIDKRNSSTNLKRYFNLIELSSLNRSISVLDVGGRGILQKLSMII